MRIQIIEIGLKKYDATHLNWFKEACDSCSTEYGVEKLEWLHSDSIDFSCDVFFKPIDRNKVQIGFLNNIKPTSHIEDQLHWVDIEMTEYVQFDALTQLLLVTIGMQYMPSVTGSFSTDWVDIKTVLRHGTKGYCCAYDWEDSSQLIYQLMGVMKLSKSEKILGSSMLLNQGLRIKETFQHVENLGKGSLFSDDCLNILNITYLEKLPSTNIFLFVSEEPQLEYTNISKASGASVGSTLLH